MALGLMGEEARDAIPALKKLRSDPDDEVRQMASKALESIGEQ
jgi:HEAT repeat protein